jgi:hypothetical protein
MEANMLDKTFSDLNGDMEGEEESLHDRRSAHREQRKLEDENSNLRYRDKQMG